MDACLPRAADTRKQRRIDASTGTSHPSEVRFLASATARMTALHRELDGWIDRYSMGTHVSRCYDLVNVTLDEETVALIYRNLDIT